MNLNPQFLSSFLVGSVICLLLVPITAKLAIQVGLTDKPTGGRKQHLGHIPLVGGIAIYISILISSLISGIDWAVMIPVLFGTSLLLLGVADDLFALSARKRLPLQIAVALAMIYFGGNSIESVGNLGSGNAVVLSGFFAIVFTVMCTVGVINSINMIDGVDGLAGTIITISVATLTYYCWKAGDIASVKLMLTVVGALLAFLFYNSRLFRSQASVFMGDAGSTLFGFFLVWYYIRLTQGDGAVLSPVSAGWIFGLPLADTVSVMVRRMSQKRSPFDADREHLHYRLMDAGFSVKNVVRTMGFVHLLFVLVGVIVNEVRSLEPVAFWLFVLVVVLHFFLLPKMLGKSVQQT